MGCRILGIPSSGVGKFRNDPGYRKIFFGMRPKTPLHSADFQLQLKALTQFWAPKRRAQIRPTVSVDPLWGTRAWKTPRDAFRARNATREASDARSAGGASRRCGRCNPRSLRRAPESDPAAGRRVAILLTAWEGGGDLGRGRGELDGVIPEFNFWSILTSFRGVSLFEEERSLFK